MNLFNNYLTSFLFSLLNASELKSSEFVPHQSGTVKVSTCSQGIAQFYLHTPRSSANEMNHTCLCLPSRSSYSFNDPRGMEG